MQPTTMSQAPPQAFAHAPPPPPPLPPPPGLGGVKMQQRTQQPQDASDFEIMAIFSPAWIESFTAGTTPGCHC